MGKSIVPKSPKSFDTNRMWSPEWKEVAGRFGISEDRLDVLQMVFTYTTSFINNQDAEESRLSESEIYFIMYYLQNIAKTTFGEAAGIFRISEERIVVLLMEYLQNVHNPKLAAAEMLKLPKIELACVAYYIVDVVKKL
ncbi:hypothetical protein [Chitinophaga sp. CF418]|uniref:hypothetical protein n=1 Tax=Chitinophaga sp. CF418 TaxID=1855287 RepID=UPI00122CC875|nr:hypothetical protein [Chitinophaga sp. CF418]